MNAFRRGDTFAYSGPIRRSVDGVLSAYDLTGWAIAASMERVLAPATTLALTAAITDAPAGIVRISRAAADTASWPLGEYILKLRLTSPAGAVVSGGEARFKVIA